MIVDIFNYNGDPIVDKRLAYLRPFVDKFVIVEGDYTFSGKQKPERFSEALVERLPEDFDKEIELVRVPDLVAGGAWANEAHQRNAGLKGLEGIPDDALVFCSDADEIPDMGRLAEVRALVAEKGCALLLQDFYYYSTRWRKKSEWPNAFAASAAVVRRYRIQEMRGRIQPRLKCGWHFSYFETPENIRRKIEAYSHTEYDKPEFKDPSYIKECLDSGKDLFGRGVHEDCLETTPEERASIPEALR